MNPQLQYRESAVAGAGPVRQVILLYEQAIEDLRRAVAACQANDVEARTRHINHATLILGCLQSALDRERGGAVAANLDRFYSQMRSGLIEAQCRQSPAAIERQIALLVEVHEAWCEVEKTEVEKTEVEKTEVEKPEAGKIDMEKTAVQTRGVEPAEAENSPAASRDVARRETQRAYAAASPGNASRADADASTPMPAESAARFSAEWNA